jgi:Flp pilus assembly protein TadD
MRCPSKLLPALLCGALIGCTNPDLRGALGDDGAAAETRQGLAQVASDIEAHGENETALTLYRQAVTVSGDAPAANVQLGDAYMRAGQMAPAIEAYRKALATSPEDPVAELGLGSALVKSGELDKGLATLVEAVPRVNTGAAYNRLGIAQTLAGRLKDARASFASGQALAPDDIDISTNLALAAALAGEPDEALASMRKVAASSAAQPRHRRNLVIVLGLLGHTAEAREVAPPGLSPRQLQALLERAGSIRAISDPKARAKALGTISG